MEVIRYFARVYPVQTSIVMLCLVTATFAEGVGLSALLPVLGIATSYAEGGDGGSGGDSPLEAIVRDVLGDIGITPSLETLIPIVIVAFWIKATFMILAKIQVGYTVAFVAMNLRLSLLRSLLSARWGYFTRQPVGAAANAMATEADRGSMAYHYMVRTLSYAVEALLYIAIALTISWKATIAALLVGLLTIMLLNFLVHMSKRAGAKQTRLLRSLLSLLTDALQAVKLLKATGRENLIGPLLESDTRKLNKALRRRVLSKEALRALQEPILVTGALTGVYFAVVSWQMALPSVMLLVGLFASAVGSTNTMQRKYQDMLSEASGLWSLLEMIEKAEAQQEHAGGTETPSLERGLKLKGVSVGYEGGDVLRDLSLEIACGQITAIIGPSGSGKTTIVDLITGLRHADAGAVWIDDAKLEDLDLRLWRTSIGYVPQETLMLNESVRMNVSLGDSEVDDEQVTAALRDAGAWDFVSKLPEGLDSSVGERGGLLSGGQRQRIAIARALLRKPKLLILDEATAALDPQSEVEIWKTVARLKQKTTVVAISHQPALMAVADRVYRIEGCKATLDPSGSHREVA